MSFRISPVDASEFRQREIDSRDAAKLLTRCAFCRWRYTGTALEGRERARQHRLEHHPELLHSRRRPHRRQLTKIRQVAMSEEDEREIMQEVKRRAFLNGVDLETESVGY